jgi:hypothetical protein
MLKINVLVKIVDFLSGNELRATSLSAIDECKKCAVRPFCGAPPARRPCPKF